jgi:formamidopyrimidine-DNA glycosylase
LKAAGVKMFELPECMVLTKQINEAMTGKIIKEGRLGNAPHKFVWYNRNPEEFSRLTESKEVGEAYTKGRWIFIPLDPGYILLLGECGGKMLYHSPGSEVPKKFHLYITFDDRSFFTVTTQMWGAMELYEKGDEQNREYVKGMKTTPIDSNFNLEYFCDLIDRLTVEKKRSVKSLLTQDQIIPGLGNSIAQDILFQAKLNPRHSIDSLTSDQKVGLYNAIKDTVHEIIAQGGRYDEVDLFNQAGGYLRIMDRNAVGKPCPRCGSEIEKIQYLGGACYLCPSCQI